MYAHIFRDSDRGVYQTPRYADYRTSSFQTNRNKILDHIAEKFSFEPIFFDRQVTQGYLIFLKYIRVLVKPGLCDGSLMEWTLLQLQGEEKHPTNKQQSGIITQISQHCASAWWSELAVILRTVSCELIDNAHCCWFICYAKTYLN